MSSDDLMHLRSSIQGRFATEDAKYLYDEQQRSQLSQNLTGIATDTFQEDFSTLSTRSIDEIRKDAEGIFQKESAGKLFYKDVDTYRKISKLPLDRQTMPLSTGEIIRRKNKMSNWLRKLTIELKTLKVAQGSGKRRFVIRYLIQMVAYASDFYGKLFNSGVARKVSLSKDIYSGIAQKFDDWWAGLGVERRERNREILASNTLRGAIARSIFARTSGKTAIGRLYRWWKYGAGGTNAKERVELRTPIDTSGFKLPNFDADMPSLPSGKGGRALPAASGQSGMLLQKQTTSQVKELMNDSVQTIIDSDGRIMDVIYSGKLNGKKFKWLQDLEDKIGGDGGLLDKIEDVLPDNLLDVTPDKSKKKSKKRRGGRRMPRGRGRTHIPRSRPSKPSVLTEPKAPTMPTPPKPSIPKDPKAKQLLNQLKNSKAVKAGKFVGKKAGPIGIAIAGLEIYDAVQSGDMRQVGRSIAGAATGMGGTAVGAAIGTMIFPGIGTAIGGLLGGTIGMIMGENMADTAMNAVFGNELKPDPLELPKTYAATQKKLDEYRKLRDKYADKTGITDWMFNTDEQLAYETYKKYTEQLEKHAKEMYEKEHKQQKGATSQYVNSSAGFDFFSASPDQIMHRPTPSRQQPPEKGLLEQGVDAVSSGFNKAREATVGAYDSVSSAASSAWTSTKNAASSAYSTTIGAAQGIIQNFQSDSGGNDKGNKSSSSGDPQAAGQLGKYANVSNVDVSGLKPDFKQRFGSAAKAYYDATGRKLPVTSAYRSPEKQAQLWVRANRLGDPSVHMPAKPPMPMTINYRGQQWQVPGSGKKGPGHMTGEAVDVPRSIAPSFEPFARKFGLGRPWPGADPVHFQVTNGSAPLGDFDGTELASAQAGNAPSGEAQMAANASAEISTKADTGPGGSAVADAGTVSAAGSGEAGAGATISASGPIVESGAGVEPSTARTSSSKPVQVAQNTAPSSSTSSFRTSSAANNGITIIPPDTLDEPSLQVLRLDIVSSIV